MQPPVNTMTHLQGNCWFKRFAGLLLLLTSHRTRITMSKCRQQHRTPLPSKLRRPEPSPAACGAKRGHLWAVTVDAEQRSTAR